MLSGLVHKHVDLCNSQYFVLLIVYIIVFVYIYPRSNNTLLLVLLQLCVTVELIKLVLR